MQAKGKGSRLRMETCDTDMLPVQENQMEGSGKEGKNSGEQAAH